MTTLTTPRSSAASLSSDTPTQVKDLFTLTTDDTLPNPFNLTQSSILKLTFLTDTSDSDEAYSGLKSTASITSKFLSSYYFNLNPSRSYNSSVNVFSHFLSTHTDLNYTSEIDLRTKNINIGDAITSISSPMTFFNY